jgi:hypothetical protein
MNRWLATLVALSAGAAVSGEPLGPPRSVNLDRPGVLEQLRETDPSTYKRIAEVIRAAETLPCETKELSLMKARDELRQLQCGALILTSFPPKRRIAFTLEHTFYTGTVAMTYAPGRVMKAHETH